MEILIIFGIIFGFAVFLVILGLLLKKLFPKNRISEKLDDIAEWIVANIRG